MDSSILKRKIAEFKTRGNRNAVWKPDPGDYTIRVVPYKHNRDWPFTEMWFYYKLTNRTILSPYTFGRPDPIKEFAESLFATGTDDNKKLGKILMPKRRVYVPIIVRGAEKEGIKFWGFSPTIYEDIVLLMDDPDYGDISDPMEGHDIKITIPKAKPGSFDGPTVRVRPKPSPVTDSEEVLKLISDMVNISEQWSEPSYEELKELLEKFAEDNDDDQPTNAAKTVELGQKKSSVSADDDEDDVPLKSSKPQQRVVEEDESEDDQGSALDVRASFKKYFK